MSFLTLRLALLVSVALVGCTPTPVEEVLTPASVQGAGARSSLEGQSVTVEGIVTADFRDGLEGVFIESIHADTDPLTAEGLFLQSAPDAALSLRTGDHVRVSGTVHEEGQAEATLTTLRVSRVTVLASQQALPAPVELTAPPEQAGDWERFEGMRLHIPGPLTITGSDNFQRFGELALAFGERLYQPTERFVPGPEAQRMAADNQRRLLLIDDASNQSPTDAVWYLPEAVNASHPLRTGSQVRAVSGVLDQRFGRYRLQLTQALGDVQQAVRPPPPTVAGDTRIASFNVLNLFNGDGQGKGFPTERGAQDFESYQRQQAKLVASLQALQPDIAALMEVENDGEGPQSALSQFVDALNQAGPASDWRRVVAEGSKSGDSIRVAIIYRSSRVQPVGASAQLLVEPFLSLARPPLAQAFRVGKGPVFVVVANHFKAKGGCETAKGDDRDLGDGQACWNATRTTSARLLAEWLGNDPTATGSDRSLIIGDLNAHAKEDPLTLLAELGWKNALQPDADEALYSFVFAGQAGRLDHALLSPALQPALRGAAEWHSNADELRYFGYHTATEQDPWRASDHDPLLIGLDLAQ